MNTQMLNISGAIEDVVNGGLLSSDEITSLSTSLKRLSVNLKNCGESREAASFMNDEQELYSISIAVAELVDGNQDLTDTVWSILCWLHQSMGALVYLKFQLEEVIRHDLNEVPISKIMPFIELKIADLFNEDRHYKQAVRYLRVLNEFLIEQGVQQWKKLY